MMTEKQARINAEKNLNNTIDEIKLNINKEIKYEKGKVRENFILPNNTRVLLTTDRVSVYDSVVGSIPFKGQVLDEITHWWFNKTKILIPNHIIDRLSSVLTITHQCDPLKIEMVVRAYLTGTTSTSILTAYKNGSREFCGNFLPDNLEKNELLPYVMITPTTKADYGKHDELISGNAILSNNLLPGDKNKQHELWKSLCNQSLILFGIGSAHADNMNLILVDTKYEFGLLNKKLILIDEIHTPDSSRYWEKINFDRKDPIALSKQFVRDAIIKQGYDPESSMAVPKLNDESRIECSVRYIMLCQRITGKEFVPDEKSMEEKIYNPLKKVGVL